MSRAWKEVVRSCWVVVFVALSATSAFAQAQVRVTADSAIIWRSDVSVPAASATVTMVLDATARSDAWFEVVIPESLGGRGERGLIAASQVAPIGDIAAIPCRALRGNPCSRPTAGAPQNAAPTGGAEPSSVRAAQASPARDAARSTSPNSTFAPGLFVQFGGGATHIGAPQQYWTYAVDGGTVIAGVSGGTGRLMFSFNAVDMVPCPARRTPRLFPVEERTGGVTIGPRIMNERALAAAKCEGTYASYAYSFDGVGLLPHSPILVGGGFRIEDKEPTWFGSGGLGWIRNNGRAFIAVRGNVGKRYYSGLVTVAIRVAGR